MDVREVENELTYFTEEYPLEAMEAATRKREEITPILLGALDKAYNERKNLDSDYMLHHFGMHLLAQFREEKAFLKLIRFLEMDKEDLNSIIGYILPESYPAILASTFNGDLEVLKRVIENSSLDQFVRRTALNAYGKLYLVGIYHREEYVNYVKELLNVTNEDDFFQWLIITIYEFKLYELLPEVKQAYESEQVDETFCSYAGFIDRLFNDETSDEAYVDDAIAATKWWACFKKNEPDLSDLSEEDRFERISQPHTKPKKIGRNDPCSCGSGKKYKKCCLNKSSPDFESQIAAYEKSILRRYPKENQKPFDDENQADFYNYFSKDAIEINHFVYSGMERHLSFPLFPTHVIAEAKIRNLLKAYTLFLEKMRTENLSTFSDFDNKYQIHHKALNWISELEDLLDAHRAHDRINGMMLREAFRKYADN